MVQHEIPKSINDYNDVLTAHDISEILKIGYVKALRLIKYGGISHLKIGNTYRVSRNQFMSWLSEDNSRVINLE